MFWRLLCDIISCWKSRITIIEIVQENGFKINIYTDSQSSIEALWSSRPRFAFVIEAKKNLYLAGDSDGLACVEAHVGDMGNELADHHAKLPTTDGEDMNVLTQLSRVIQNYKKSNEILPI
ncbi:hypothetical protein AVEN_206245-1 [Araneus ventricosus]|uniref:RNase H type-1 domain-containing protein n=1 Tax=Araneus ventricosus TaxID=182803 RepID=A0A4Y2LAQ5_ARAVE|nr:hypothetical protein AVEN_206245-1 [Araneus ventricosus]